MDSKGRLIVAATGLQQVQVYKYDSTQNQYSLIATYGTSDGLARWLYNYASPADGLTADEVIPTTANNSAVCPCLAFPQSVAVDAQDRIYLTDTGNYRVLVFDSADNAINGTLQLLYTFGTFAGTVVDTGPLDASGHPILDANGNVVNVLFENPSSPQPDHFAWPLDIAVYKKTGEVFVLDQANNQIVGFRFDSTAQNFKQFVAFGHRGDTSVDPNGLVFPSGMGLDQITGDIAVADSGKHRAVVFRRSNSLTSPFTADTQPSAFIGTTSSGQPVIGRTSGYLQQGDVAFDRADRLFILDSVSSAIHVFAPSGDAYQFQFTIQKGTSQFPGDLADALGLDVAQPNDPNDTLPLESDPLGRLIVADTYASRVQIFQHASLSAAVTTGSATAMVGGSPITATVTITNDGFVPLINIAPAFQGLAGVISSAPGAVTVTPASIASLQPGAHQDFGVTLIPQATGVLNLQVGGTGRTDVFDVTDKIFELAVAAPFVGAPAVTISCDSTAGANSLVLKSATISSSAVQSNGSIAIHVTLRNCSAVPVQAVPTIATSGVPVSPAGAMSPLPLAAAGQAADTASWDVGYTAGTTNGVASFVVSASTADGSATVASPITLTTTISNDITPPVTTATINPAPSDATHQIYRGPVTVQLQATDNTNGTGIAAIHCSYVVASSYSGATDCSPSVTGNPATFKAPAPFALPEGQVTLTFWSVDAATPPNAEAPHVLTLVIDNTPPNVAWSVAPTPNAAGWNNSPVTVSFIADDTGTPIASVKALDPLIPLTTPTSFVLADADAILGPKIIATDAAGNQTISQQVVKIDQLKPTLVPTRTPMANASGWNNSLPVVVSWKVFDTLPRACPRGVCQVSDIRSAGVVNCPLGGCQPAQTVTGCPAACAGVPPTTITSEGTTHVIAAACDVAGNCNTVDAAVLVGQIQVDVTPPESFNQFDPATKTNAVYARDNLSGVQSTPIQPVTWPALWIAGDDSDDDSHDDDNSPSDLRLYTMADAAGNTQALTEKVHADGHEVHVSVVGFLYTTGCPTRCSVRLGAVPSGTTKKFEWSTNQDGSLKTLEQQMTIGRGKNRAHVEADYDSKKNQTTIQTDTKGAAKVTLPGLVLLRLATANGALDIEYTNPATHATVVFTPGS